MSKQDTKQHQLIEELSLKSQQLRNKIYVLVKEKLEIDDTLEKLWNDKERLTVKNRVLKILEEEQILIGDYNRDIWKQFTTKPIEGRRGKQEEVVFRSAVAIWLAPLLPNREIAEIFGIDVSSVNYLHRMFLNEYRIRELTREMGPIETLIKKFNNYETE